MIGVDLGGTTLINFTRDRQASIEDTIAGVHLAESKKIRQTLREERVTGATHLKCWLIGGNVQPDARVRAPQGENRFILVVFVINPAIIKSNAIFPIWFSVASPPSYNYRLTCATVIKANCLVDSRPDAFRFAEVERGALHFK
jgi:hypothetical protein